MEKIKIRTTLAMSLIILGFSLSQAQDEKAENQPSGPQNGTEYQKSHEKGPVYSPLKVKPYTKRTYKA